MITYTLTHKKNGLVADVDGDKYNGFYLYDDVVCIERWNINSIKLSDDFRSRSGCQLIKRWEYDTFDIDPYGRKYFTGGKTTREIWDISELMKCYGATPKHINIETNYDIQDFLNNR